MQKRNKWIYKTENGVKVYSPTSDSGKSRYYRIVCPYNGRFRDTTATSEDLAGTKSIRISFKIKSRRDLRSDLPVTYFLDAYLDSSLQVGADVVKFIPVAIGAFLACGPFGARC